MWFFGRFLFCVGVVTLFLFAYVEQHNRLTRLRIEVPLQEKKLKELQDENTRLQFEIEKFENPLNLMELAKKPQFSHLKHPYVTDIITVEINRVKK
jgi:uncharacterized coiled-coil protein SlyX